MNKTCLQYLGIKHKREADNSQRKNRAAATKFVQYEDDLENKKRTLKKLLRYIPLSSSLAERLNIYDKDEMNYDKKAQNESICKYEKFCVPKYRLFKNHKTKNGQKARFASIVSINTMSELSIIQKKRLGPIVRIQSLDLTRFSPYYRYYSSSLERRLRLRYLEYGLTKSGRCLARGLKRCEVRVSRLEPSVISAYTSMCRVKVKQITVNEREITHKTMDNLPTISLSRLTPDHVASYHNKVRVRVERLRMESASDIHNNDHYALRDPFGFSCVSFETCKNNLVRKADSQPNLAERTVVSESNVNVNAHKSPTFLTPDARPAQKLLEPEEIAFPDFSITSSDPDVSESYDIMSIASSSATSAVQSSDNSSSALSQYGRWKEYGSSCALHSNQRSRLSKYRRNADYVNSNLPSISRQRAKRVQVTNYESKSASNQNRISSSGSSRKKQREISSHSQSPNRRFKRRFERVVSELGTFVLTRCRSKTSTTGVIIFEKRSRSASSSRSHR